MERWLKSKLPNGIFTNVTPTRSRAMAAVKSRGNKTTEVRFRMALVRAGVSGFVVQPKGLPGNPDFYFPAPKLAVFVDGCFWHGCGRCGRIPESNRVFWEAKIGRNRKRHLVVKRLLKTQNMALLRFWEHEIREKPEICVAKILAALSTKGEPGPHIEVRKDR